MTQILGSRPLLERWLALVVRYWAFNMTLIHDTGGDWPGFGYSEEEKSQLKTIAAKTNVIEFGVWVALCAVLFILIVAISGIAALACLSYATDGAHNVSMAPAALYSLTLALVLVLGFTLGFPGAMLPAAALTGRWFRVADADLPDHPSTAHYYHKLWFQIARLAVLCVAVMVPCWIFIPSDSKIFLVGRLVLPLLSPAVGALTTAYYFSARLRRQAGQVAAPGA